MEEILIQDNSGDKDNFTIIPNYIANHSTANDQALYFQMKRLAGDKGQSFASEKYFMDKLGIGRKALKKAIHYLLNNKWISYVGYKDTQTKGGIQKIKVYKINNIWKMNTEYYQGVSESTLLYQGVSERAGGGVQKDIQGVSERAPINIKENNIYITNIRESPFQKTKLFFQLLEEKNPEYYKTLGAIITKKVESLDVEQRKSFDYEMWKFMNYWCELDQSGRKQRWERQETFEVSRRVATWLSNKKEIKIVGNRKMVGCIKV